VSQKQGVRARAREARDLVLPVVHSLSYFDEPATITICRHHDNGPQASEMPKGRPDTFSSWITARVNVERCHDVERSNNVLNDSRAAAKPSKPEGGLSRLHILEATQQYAIDRSVLGRIKKRRQ
jgi:hypothetical protein